MKRTLAVLGATLAVASAAAQPLPSAHDTVDCRMLAAIPNAPMSVESCERRMRSHAELMSALHTPGGERPGDERMSCAQIAEEMKSIKVSGVSAANAAEGRAAAESVMAIMQRAQVEALGMAGMQTARGAAAAMVPGNAAGQAAAMATMAEQAAMQERLAAQMNPARERLDAASASATSDLARSMRENPRFARLLNLAIQRNCSG